MIRFSKSKLNTFLSCSEKYRLGYEMGLKPMRKSKSLIEGSCIHHLVESGLLYNQQIEDVLEQASRAFWSENPFERCDYESEAQYRAAQALCLDQSRSFLEQLDPLPVSHMEMQLEAPLVHPLTLEEDPEITLIGYIDLVLRDSSGGPWLIDLKTVARTPREGMAKVALELTMYAYLYGLPEESYVFPSLPVALVYLIRTKMPKVHWDESRRFLPHFMELYHICRKVAEDISNQHFFRNPGMHCSYCDFRSLCFEEAENAIELFGEERWEMYRIERESRQDQVLMEAAAVNF